MSDATLRASIKSLMEEIPGAGKIHDYERWAPNPDNFIKLFLNEETNKISGWEITRNGVPQVEWITRKCKVTHSYQIKGYYGLKDAEASEKSFNAIVDALLLKFISKRVAGTNLHTLPTVGIIQARTFGAILCHYAEVNLKVSEIVAPVSDEELVDLLKVGLNYYLKPGDDREDATDVVDLEE